MGALAGAHEGLGETSCKCNQLVCIKLPSQIKLEYTLHVAFATADICMHNSTLAHISDWLSINSSDSTRTHGLSSSLILLYEPHKRPVLRPHLEQKATSASVLCTRSAVFESCTVCPFTRHLIPKLCGSAHDYSIGISMQYTIFSRMAF